LIRLLGAKYGKSWEGWPQRCRNGQQFWPKGRKPPGLPSKSRKPAPDLIKYVAFSRPLLRLKREKGPQMEAFSNLKSKVD